jgi:hypothetical protein
MKTKKPKAKKNNYFKRKFKRNNYLMDEARIIADLREEFEDFMTKEQKEKLDSLMQKAKTMKPADFGLEVGWFILELQKHKKNIQLK